MTYGNTRGTSGEIQADFVLDPPSFPLTVPVQFASELRKVLLYLSMNSSEISSASRIKHALFLPGWTYAGGDIHVLKKTATIVIATEYGTHMEGYLYCPACFTNLTRTPKEKAVFSNGRRACFAHLSSYKTIPCDLRSIKPKGKYYSTEEEATRAIASNELIVISSFIARPASPSGNASGTFQQAPVEDKEGPMADIPISRHRGKRLNLPTRLQTITAICRNFDVNLYRYYVFPGKTAAIRLVDCMTDIASITEINPNPRLYYGVIERSANAGLNPKPTNIRMTKMKCHSSVKDFYLKDLDRNQTEKGIADDSMGRIVLMWGAITKNGIGLCIERPEWGEYALLPAKYNQLLLA